MKLGEVGHAHHDLTGALYNDSRCGPACPKPLTMWGCALRCTRCMVLGVARCDDLLAAAADALI